MKFLADMGISPRTVEFLRSLKHEAMHLSEEGLERLPDAAILEKARRERQVLLTSDLDFAELIAASQEKLPSVIIFRLRSMRPANVNHHLCQLRKTKNETHRSTDSRRHPIHRRVSTDHGPALLSDGSA